MRAQDYFKDCFFYLLSIVVFLVLMIWLFCIFHINFLCAFLIIFFYLFIFVFWIGYDYWKRKHFYDDVMDKLNHLSQKYLLVELMEHPTFLEGELLYQILLETDKDMNEHIKTYERKLKQFKEYLEMWVHEVKTPLARSFLLLPKEEKKNLKELEKALTEIENNVDQVLYYARSEVTEKDYYIHPTNLQTVVNKVIVKNQDSFIYGKVQLELKDLDVEVNTDAKWLAFILNQLIQNSLKYRKEKDTKIVISKEESEKGIYLSVWDNGIGIKQSELPKVFDQSFTGSNGRIGKASTGMGLYICKNLCEKLGHKIMITSKENEYTKVTIVFGKNNYYEVLERR